MKKISLIEILYAFALFFIIIILMAFLLTKLSIWYLTGISGYNLSDRFWYIFTLNALMLPFLKV